MREKADRPNMLLPVLTGDIMQMQILVVFTYYNIHYWYASRPKNCRCYLPTSAQSGLDIYAMHKSAMPYSSSKHKE